MCPSELTGQDHVQSVYFGTYEGIPLVSQTLACL